MKRFLSMLLVLAIVFILSGTALATDNNTTFGDYGVNGNGQSGQGNINVQGGNNTIGGTSVEAVTGNSGTIQGGTGGAGGSALVGNGIGNFSPSAKATIEKGAVSPVISPTINPVNNNSNLNVFSPYYNPTNTVTVAPVISPTTTSSATAKGGNVTIGGGAFERTLSPENTLVNQPDQTIAPVQTVTIKNPDKIAVGSAPNLTDTELNFISPNERDVQTILPKFGCGTIKPVMASDYIVDVLWQSNDIKFKDLYREVLKGLRSKEVLAINAKSVRYQIREAASTITWTTGGELAANAVGMVGSAVSGITGAVVPKKGRSKSSNLYTVIFVIVQEFKN